MLTDTHCHLNILAKEKFDVLLQEHDYQAIPNIINAASQKKVSQIINVGTSLVESLNCIELAKRFANVWATVGIHPNDLTNDWQADLKKLKPYLDHKQEFKIVGIGECGLDFYYEGYNFNQQRDGFRAQIELALKYNLPLSVHTRVAPQETLQILDEYVKNNVTGVIHCFSENLDFARQVIAWGFVLGIGGIITYPKNDDLRQIVQTISLNDFVLETDSPYLPIQTRRGKTNYPEYIYDIALYISTLKNCSIEQLANATNANVKKIFQI
jgi:TatD DNase family protein